MIAEVITSLWLGIVAPHLGMAQISRGTMSAAFNGKSCKESTIRVIADAMECRLDEITAAG